MIPGKISDDTEQDQCQDPNEEDSGSGMRSGSCDERHWRGRSPHHSGYNFQHSLCILLLACKYHNRLCHENEN